MAQRIKVTGYISQEENPEMFDLTDPTGMTEEAYDDVTGLEGTWKISDLEDIETEVVDD